MSDYFDEQDTQPAAQREQALFENLGGRLQKACDQCPGLAAHLVEAGLAVNDLPAISSRAALQQLPVLRKSALMQAQKAAPPFGGFVPESALAGTRVFMSPGPVWEPQVSGPDPWQCARALHAAGLRVGHRVHNAFGYHLTPGGFILDEGARALGCAVLPAGVGNTDAQVEALAHFRPQAFIGTPDFLQVLLDRACELGADAAGLAHAMVSGGALFPAIRERYAEQGVQVMQCYATADLGVLAYESRAEGELVEGMVVNEGLILEIVKPGTGEPVGAGEVGEVVVTRLHPDYPLLRFATGDLSAFIDTLSPCGRTAPRIRGWMGRADQRTKVRGMFIDPAQAQALRKALPGVQAIRLLVGREADRDVMTVQLHGDGAARPDDAAVHQAIRAHTGLAGKACWVDEPLPNDGVVIEDQRDYSA